MKQSSTPLFEVERWLPAVGYEGLYEVSDLGRVNSLQRSPGAGGILKPQLKGGYRTVNLYRNRKMRTMTVHVLVARAFLGPAPAGRQVCHGPAGRLDNSLSNLSYGTLKKNLGSDKHRDGTMQQGVRNGKATLTNDIVRQLRTRSASGESNAALGRAFGVARNTVRDVLTGRTWRHVA